MLILQNIRWQFKWNLSNHNDLKCQLWIFWNENEKSGNNGLKFSDALYDTICNNWLSTILSGLLHFIVLQTVLFLRLL